MANFSHPGRGFLLGDAPSFVEMSAEDIVAALERQEIGLATPIRVGPDAKPTPVARYLRQIVWMARQETGASKEEVSLLKAAFDHAPFGLVIADLAGRVLECNAAFATLLGYTREELVGVPIGSLSPGTDRTEEIALGMEMVTGLRSSFQVEKRFVTRTGEPVDTLTAVAMLQDRAGMPAGVVGHVLDIGTRKRLESLVAEQAHARAEVEERFESLFRNAPQAMIMVDASSRIRQSNHAASRLFGYSTNQLDGLSLSELLPSSLRSSHEQLVATTTASGSMGQMAAGRDVSAVRRNGEVLLVEVGLVPLRVGGVQLTLAGISDVTAARRAREALTKSLHEKETLLREVHHRVKNNLQIVSSLLTVQADLVPPGPIRAALLDSVGRVRSMALVHQLLYSLDSLARVDLKSYIQELAPGLARALRPEVLLRVEGQAIEVSPEVAVPLGLILNELISNALKHAMPLSDGAPLPSDEPWNLRVSVGPGELGVVLRVEDHGPGMPEELPESSGSLGMILIRSLVRQLRGQLVVRNERGARIEVRAPSRSWDTPSGEKFSAGKPLR